MDNILSKKLKTKLHFENKTFIYHKNGLWSLEEKIYSFSHILKILVIFANNCLAFIITGFTKEIENIIYFWTFIKARMTFDPVVGEPKLNISQISYEWPALFVDTVEWVQHRYIYYLG